MALIVDCYNVLHVSMPPVLAGLDEGRLCEALSRSPWAESPITVVADGRPKPLRASESPAAGVELIFAGSHRSADELIIQQIRHDSAPRRLTVVSSDREIRAAARRRRARDLSSEDFVEKLARYVQRRGIPRPVSARPAVDPLPPELVQRWKRAFGFRPHD